MRKITRAASVLSSGVLAVGLVSGVGGGVAGASPGAQARSCNYPPGNCQVLFDKSTYHRGDTVNFVSDKAFNRHEPVDGKLRCKHGSYHHSEGTFKAHHHKVSGSFTLG